MAKNYKDFGKDAKDLLSLDFLSGGGLNIVGTGNLPNNINLKVNFKRTVKDKETYDLSFEPKFEFKPQNAELSAKLSTTEQTSTLIVKDVATKGTKLELGVDSRKDLLGLRIIPGYKTDNLSLQSTVNYPVRAAKPDLNLSNEAVFQFKKGYFLGLKVDTVLDPKNVAKATHRIDAALHVALPSGGQLSGRIGTSTKDQNVSWGLAFFNKLPSGFKWAVDYAADAKGSVLALGGELKHDEDHTFKSKLSAKTNGDLREAVAWKYFVSKHVTFIAGVDINLRDLIGGANTYDKHSYGLELKYNH